MKDHLTSALAQLNGSADWNKRTGGTLPAKLTCFEAQDVLIALQELQTRAERAEAELAAERARMDDLVADIKDACITLASAKDDCDDYALLNTGFKITAVRDVLIQYIPRPAMKEGEK